MLGVCLGKVLQSSPDLRVVVVVVVVFVVVIVVVGVTECCCRVQH